MSVESKIPSEIPSELSSEISSLDSSIALNDAEMTPQRRPSWLPAEHQVLRIEGERRLYLVQSLSALPSELWDACIGPNGSPFLRHSFLWGLERCGCIEGDTGWYGRYLLLEYKDELIAVTAAYVKTHSQGEFIFDWSWADAAHRAGLPYYPKLTLTSPFSPVASDKLATLNTLETETRHLARAHLWRGIRDLVFSEGLTGVHALFVSPEESAQLEELGALTRHTLQFQWSNEGYRRFDDFLARFRSKRRNQIKRERRRVRESGVYVNAYCGDEVQPEHIEIIYNFYRATVEKYFFGNLYLNREFFEHLYQHQRESLCLLLAERDGEVLGGSFNLMQGGVLYGRYWGCDAEIPYLHFEVCAYRGIELCIERGWSRFEAGAGGGSHKFGRGFLPRVIYSSHDVYLPGFKDALSGLLQSERNALALELDAVRDEVLKRSPASL